MRFCTKYNVRCYYYNACSEGNICKKKSFCVDKGWAWFNNAELVRALSIAKKQLQEAEIKKRELQQALDELRNAQQQGR